MYVCRYICKETSESMWYQTITNSNKRDLKAKDIGNGVHPPLLSNTIVRSESEIDLSVTIRSPIDKLKILQRYCVCII